MPTRSANSSAVTLGKTRIENLRIVDVAATAEEGSLIASAGFKADGYKAYLEFDICHTLPEIAGPVQSMNYIGYTADTLEASHSSLLHQQFNIRHLLKAYGGDAEGQGVARDRIIGCVVATSFPKKPLSGWVAGQAIPIRAVATVFKLAEGVAKLLGEHVTSRNKQSVSIETITSFGNIGVHRLSTGETWPILDLPANVSKALSEVEGSMMPHVGKMGGEQLVVVYGIGQPISLRGVGMTATPAEQAARIVAVQASKQERDADTFFMVSAEQVPQDMVGQTVPFKSGRTGRILRVCTEGHLRIAGLKVPGTIENPALLIGFSNGDTVLRRCADVMA